MNLKILIIVAYLLGSFPTALLIGQKYFKKDIRREGSGNLGGTNAGRVLGKKIGLIVSLIDVLKVFIPSLIAKIYFGIDDAALVGFAAMLGHCYPIFAHFKGGKGVSSYLGIGIALNPYISFAVFLIWFALRYITNYVSVASMISCLVASMAILIYYGNIKAFYIMLFAALFVIYLHRENIKRLIDGTENKVRK